MNRSSLQLKPDKYCLACPENALCGWDATLTTLALPPGFWRLSNKSTIVTECSTEGSNTSRCSGGTNAGLDGQGYCAPFYVGPLCAFCTSGLNGSTYYHDVETDSCKECPDAGRKIGMIFAVLIAICAFCGLMKVASEHRRTRDSVLMQNLRMAFHFFVSFALMYVSCSSSTVLPSTFIITEVRRPWLFSPENLFAVCAWYSARAFAF